VKKASLVERVTSQAKETASLGALLVKEPKAFPAASLQVFKRVFRKVWHARGGGLYACGFFATFIWLEISLLFGEVFAAESVGAFFSEQLFELLIRFSVMSIQNTVSALIWPVHIIMLSPVVGGIIVAGMFFVFSRFIEEPLEHWLFGDEEESLEVTGKERNPDNR
jgi:hypothetical protein